MGVVLNGIRFRRDFYPVNGVVRFNGFIQFDGFIQFNGFIQFDRYIQLMGIFS